MESIRSTRFTLDNNLLVSTKNFPIYLRTVHKDSVTHREIIKVELTQYTDDFCNELNIELNIDANGSIEQLEKKVKEIYKHF